MTAPMATQPATKAPQPPTGEACKHKAKISSCGIKVCMDCGAPLNEVARRLASRLGA